MSESLVELDMKNIGKELILINYPGMVKDTDKMIETLGGLSKLSKTMCGDNKRLELRFHPKNVFNKPVNGDSYECNGFLFKVRIRRPKNKQSTKQVKSFVEILGHIKTGFRFNALCDFQYLPIDKNQKTGSCEYLYNKLFPQGIHDFEYFSRTDVPLFCPPYVFARSDTMFKRIHRGEITDESSEVLGGSNCKMAENRYIIMFSLTDTFPTKPNPQVVKRMTVKYVSDEQLQKVKQLFDECPIWNRVSLIYLSGINNEKIRIIIPSLAYYFTTGPWRAMYARYGYDPRKDFNSRYYQAFDFRLRVGAAVGEYVKLKKLVSKSSNSSNAAGNEFIQNELCPYFEENKLPRSRQCIFRYCDIRIPKIQEMLEKIPRPLTGATCNEKTGWLPPGFDDQCRQILATCVRDVMKRIYQMNLFPTRENEDEEEISGDENPDEDDTSDEVDEIEEEVRDAEMDID